MEALVIRGAAPKRRRALAAAFAVAMTARAAGAAAFAPPSSPLRGRTRATKTSAGRGDKRAAPGRSSSALSAASSAASSAAANAVPIPSVASAISSIPRPPVAPSNLAVSLDRPLLSPAEYAYRSPSLSGARGVWSSFLTVLLSDVCKTALVAFLLAAAAALLPKLIGKWNAKAGGAGGTSSGSSSGAAGAGGIRRFFSSLVERLPAPVRDLLPAKAAKSARATYSAPMPFDGSGGWGKCTLRSTKSVGGFDLYEFSLPETYYVVPLALGQQLDFCCLSSNDDMCTGSFYPMGDGEGGGAGTGCVRVAVPRAAGGGDEGGGGSKFTEVLRDELRPGDEVAIRPGKSHLTYRGKHVPVTDMVYVASGAGIVPVVDQVKSILPRGSSSVKVASVVWLNDGRDDFDLAVDDLEAEYLKHPSRLAVSCILADGGGRSSSSGDRSPLEGNPEAEEAVPYYDAGTMAVVSGPRKFAEGARGYLMRRGYPEDCICILPS